MVLYTGTRFLLHHPSSFEKACPFSAHSIREILTFSLPLSTNRVCLSLLQSAESICIPLRLQAFGLARSAALSSYGTLTGMALPLVLFPSAVTNALSVMLLPAVSESQAGKDRKAIARLSVRTVQSCLLLGILCTIFFLVFGNLCGILLFDSNEAGTYIQILSWLCPFLYLGTTLASILNGLGKTFLVFLSNMACTFYKIFIRLVCHSFFRYQRLSARTAFFTASAQPAVAFLPEPQFILKCCQVSVVCFLYKKTFPGHTNFRGTKTSAFEMRPIQGGIEMNELSELDLQNLRHLIGGFDTTHCKMTAYAQEAGDPAVKQFFQKSAQSAMQCKQQLMTFLQ